jgi:hypothetical protein
MPQTLGQEPQVQMYERENIKRKYTMPSYGQFTYLLAFNQLEGQPSKEQKQSSAHLWNN